MEKKRIVVAFERLVPMPLTPEEEEMYAKIRHFQNTFQPSPDEVLAYARMCTEMVNAHWDVSYWWKPNYGEYHLNNLDLKYVLDDPPRGGADERIARIRRWRTEEAGLEYAITLCRHIAHAKSIRDELQQEVRRREAIRACRRMKEELYMNVYHPRRIERLLEVGGWEALDNFAGL